MIPNTHVVLSPPPPLGAAQGGLPADSRRAEAAVPGLPRASQHGELPERAFKAGLRPALGLACRLAGHACRCQVRHPPHPAGPRHQPAPCIISCLPASAAVQRRFLPLQLLHTQPAHRGGGAPGAGGAAAAPRTHQHAAGGGAPGARPAAGCWVSDSAKGAAGWVGTQTDAPASSNT